jgi:hypothetical protein
LLLDLPKVPERLSGAIRFSMADIAGTVLAEGAASAEDVMPLWGQQLASGVEARRA